MQSGRIVILFSLLTLGYLTSAYAQTQGELTQDACLQYRKAREEMDGVYRQILKDYKAELAFLAKIRAAQTAWLRYRDAHIRALYPDPDPTTYGSVLPMCKCQLLATMTTARVKELQQWTIGVEEGEVCAGSRKISDAQ